MGASSKSVYLVYNYILQSSMYFVEHPSTQLWTTTWPQDVTTNVRHVSPYIYITCSEHKQGNGSVDNGSWFCHYYIPWLFHFTLQYIYGAATKLRCICLKTLTLKYPQNEYSKLFPHSQHCSSLKDSRSSALYVLFWKQQWGNMTIWQYSRSLSGVLYGPL